MRILSRYLIHAHAGPFVFAFTALTGLLFLNAVAQRMDNLVGKGLPWEVIGEFVLLSLPHTIALTLPMAILVSVLYTFSELTAANEITAMSAGGIQPLRMLRPILGMGIILGGVMLYFNDQVLPAANHQLKTLIIDMGKKSPTLELRERVVNHIEMDDGTGTVYLQAATIDPVTNDMTEVVIYDLSDPTAHRTTYAERGHMEFNSARTDLYLTLYDGRILEVGADRSGEFNQSEFEVQVLPMRGVGDELERREGGSMRTDREMSIAMLKTEAEARLTEIERVRDRGGERAQMAVELALGRPPDPTQTVDRTAGRGRSARGPQRLNEFLTSRDDMTRGVALNARQNVTQVGALRTSVNQYRVEIHKKYAIAFACIVFVLIGAPLAIRFPRGGVGMVIAVSVSIFAIYWAGLIGGENLADRGVMSPFWAMWTADLVFLAFGIALLARMGREGGANRGGAWDEILFALGDWLRKVTRLPGASA